MKFAHPEILFALSAVAIPILVHLFNFRKFKRIYFSNIAFLKEVKLQTQSRSRLKHYLILAARILAITCLVFAFARPFFPTGGQGGASTENAVSVFVDNSFSMDAESTEGRLLNIARNKAFEIANGFAPTDKFQMLTQDFEGRHQRMVSREEMTDLIAETESSGRSRTLSEIIQRQSDALQKQPESRKHIFIISDFQNADLGDWQAPRDSSLSIYLVPSLPQVPANLSLDSAWFENPVHQLGQQERLSVRISNHSQSAAADVPMNLTVNGEQKAFGTFSVAAGDRVDTALFFSNIETGLKHLTISIEDQPVVFDNAFHLSYEVASSSKVLIVSPSGKDRYASDVFATDPFYQVTETSAGAINFSDLGQYDLLVLSGVDQVSTGMAQEVEKLVANGLNLLVFPPKENGAAANLLMERLGSAIFGAPAGGENRTREINTAHPLFKALFASVPANPNLPVANKWYPRPVITQSNEAPLLIMQNGERLMTAKDFGAGKVFVFNVPLDPEWSNLPNHALFPAILLRIGETSAVGADGSYIIGRNASVLLRNRRISGDQTLRLRQLTTGTEIIPEQRQTPGGTEVFIPEELDADGHYLFVLDNETVFGAGFNFDRAESETAFVSPEDAKQLLLAAGAANVEVLDGSGELLSGQINEAREGKTLWKTFLIWALIFLAIETLLIKFWK